ncbi:hypothetical protein SLEP1_g18880 [Rubroshorea leprosula]|uniref:Uncharacterized protein n=1 Tax=Rubroshorea leprosula TaxID=152421 RepID=A0AAV5IYY4_9ROSI|nr:hypothetical protein SLEP1_g18880 [Rubroshorea leprosula]
MGLRTLPLKLETADLLCSSFPSASCCGCVGVKF